MENKEKLVELKEKLSKLTEQENKLRDIYLQKIAKGKIDGPMTGLPSLDKPWLQYYDIETKNQSLDNVDCTMYEFLLNSFKSNENDPIISYFGNKITFAEFDRKVKEYALSLRKYGIKCGDTICVALPNIPEMAYYIYACSLIGATAYTLDPRTNPVRMNECLNISESSLFITLLTGNEEKTSELIKNQNCKKIVLVSPIDSIKRCKNLMMYPYIIKENIKKNEFRESNTYCKKCLSETFIQKVPKNNSICIKPERNPQDEVAIVNTSGTTGTPKGAILTNKGINNSVKNTKIVAPSLDRRQTYMGCIPMFSMYGLNVGFHTAACIGMKTYLMPTFNPAKYDKTYAKLSPSIAIAVPKIFNTFVDSKYGKKTQFENAKLLIMGGDKIFKKQLDQINNSVLKNGSNVMISYGYGLTEGGPIAFGPTHYDDYIDGSCGLIRPEVTCKIVDRDTNEELGYNEKGELYINSAAMMSSYLNNEEESKKIEYIDPITKMRYFKTGDEAYIRENGELIVTGRYKRLIKRPDGHQVNTEEIEKQIMKHPFVKNSAVTGVKSMYQNEGEIPTAFIELNEGVNAIENKKEILDSIIEFLRQRISGEREMPLAFVLDVKIPYTQNGKVDFVKLSKMPLEDLNAYYVDDPIFKGYFVKTKKINYI